MPQGKGTYGSKRGRPPANKTGSAAAKLKAKNPKMPAKVAKAIAKKHEEVMAHKGKGSCGSKGGKKGGYKK